MPFEDIFEDVLHAYAMKTYSHEQEIREQPSTSAEKNRRLEEDEKHADEAALNDIEVVADQILGGRVVGVKSELDVFNTVLQFAPEYDTDDFEYKLPTLQRRRQDARAALIENVNILYKNETNLAVKAIINDDPNAALLSNFAMKFMDDEGKLAVKDLIEKGENATPEERFAFKQTVYGALFEYFNRRHEDFLYMRTKETIENYEELFTIYKLVSECPESFRVPDDTRAEATILLNRAQTKVAVAGSDYGYYIDVDELDSNQIEELWNCHQNGMDISLETGNIVNVNASVNKVLDTIGVIMGWGSNISADKDRIEIKTADGEVVDTAGAYTQMFEKRVPLFISHKDEPGQEPALFFVDGDEPVLGAEAEAAFRRRISPAAPLPPVNHSVNINIFQKAWVYICSVFKSTLFFSKDMKTYAAESAYYDDLKSRYNTEERTKAELRARFPENKKLALGGNEKHVEEKNVEKAPQVRNIGEDFDEEEEYIDPAAMRFENELNDLNVPIDQKENIAILYSTLSDIRAGLGMRFWAVANAPAKPGVDEAAAAEVREENIRSIAAVAVTCDTVLNKLSSEVREMSESGLPDQKFSTEIANFACLYVSAENANEKSDMILDKIEAECDLLTKTEGFKGAALDKDTVGKLFAGSDMQKRKALDDIKKKVNPPKKEVNGEEPERTSQLGAKTTDTKKQPVIGNNSK